MASSSTVAMTPDEFFDELDKLFGSDDGYIKHLERIKKLKEEKKKLKEEKKKLKEDLKMKEDISIALQRQADDEHIRFLDEQVKAYEYKEENK